MKPDHDYVTLYHGTTAAALAGIRESGFVPNAQDAFVLPTGWTPTRGFCYFTTSYCFAQAMAWWREAAVTGGTPPELAQHPYPPQNAVASPGVVVTIEEV